MKMIQNMFILAFPNFRIRCIKYVETHSFKDAFNSSTSAFSLVLFSFNLHKHADRKGRDKANVHMHTESADGLWNG